jgi:hypothetical protein
MTLTADAILALATNMVKLVAAIRCLQDEPGDLARRHEEQRCADIVLANLLALARGAESEN